MSDIERLFIGRIKVQETTQQEGQRPVTNTTDSLDCDLPEEYKGKTVKEVVDYTIQSATAKEQMLADTIGSVMKEFGREADPLLKKSLVCELNGKPVSLDTVISNHVLVDTDIQIGSEHYTGDLVQISFLKNIVVACGMHL